MIEELIAYITRAKQSTKEKFLEEYPERGNLWEILQNSKEGYITIEKISSNAGYLRKGEIESGYTPAFGEGIACWIDNKDSYYHTSNIESINWEDNTFNTLNSKYKFKFDERKNKEVE